VSGGQDKVEEHMDVVVVEAWITVDAQLLHEDVVVLVLEVGHNFLEPTSKVNW
jgi:hypothetical protein